MKDILNILTHRRTGYVDTWKKEDIENFFFVLKLLRLQTAKDLDSLEDLKGYSTLALSRRERDRDNK
jgi:hypothetical protein